MKENELLEKWGILLRTKQNRNFSKLSLLVRIESYAIILSNSFEPVLKNKVYYYQNIDEINLYDIQNL